MKPLVAIVGRPNVGKSTLFNRLVGGSPAMVHDSPGVTRDRHHADAHVHGREVTLVDTGGFDSTTTDPMGRGIRAQVRSAIDEADLIVCVLDGSAPPTAPDADAVDLLRKSGKPTLFAANKVDRPDRTPVDTGIYALGISDPIPVSALHGRGTAELLAAIVRNLPESEPESAPEEDLTQVALVGRPNAGKSSLFNRLAGSERVLVDSEPGTTRDPIDTIIIHKKEKFLLVDTAGIRRRARVDTDIEASSVMRAIRAMERARIAVLMVDISEGLAEQDLRILRLATDRGRAVVLALSKADLVRAKQRDEAIEQAQKRLSFARWIPVLPISTKSGDGVAVMMKAVLRANEELRRRIPTGELNRFMKQVIEKQPPPTHMGRSPRIYYVTQAHADPPVFVAVTNAPDHIKESYKRFMANQIRKSFGFGSVPLRVQYRARSRGASEH